MNIVIIGSGNVAWHFAKFFHSNGHVIRQISSRTSANGNPLADAVFAQYIDNPQNIDRSADLIILAVSDDALSALINQLPDDLECIVAHTSGATSINNLFKFRYHAVIYPPQSLNKDIDTNLSAIPFAIEASDDLTRESILNLMGPIAPRTFYCTSKQRLSLHISSVFINNFSNALYRIAYNIMEQENLPFELAHPIILETAQKALKTAPHLIQTGPAARNDTITINKHLEFLANEEDLKEIYQRLTNLIIKSR